LSSRETKLLAESSGGLKTGLAAADFEFRIARTEAEMNCPAYSVNS
jgi:hypothetical protein